MHHGRAMISSELGTEVGGFEAPRHPPTIASKTEIASSPSRILGYRLGSQPGPTVVLLAGVHGNEPAGLAAVRSVFDGLPRDMSGELIGVAGNLQALARNARFLKRDLNRGWNTSHLEYVLSQDPSELEAEEREQRALIDLFEQIASRTPGPVIFVDLHTMSGPGAPFVCMADVIRNRRIAFALPIPVVLGLEEVIEGAMIGYLCDLGHVGIVVEGGQHDDPAAATCLEAAAWLALVAAGSLAPESVPKFESYRKVLETHADGLPPVIEICHRHECTMGDGFQMAPGYSSFQNIRKGECVAQDSSGDICVSQTGLMLLPRYQGAGSDGFFVARSVRKFWLHLSAQLRRMRADRWLVKLPGVERHPERSEVYLVDPNVARIKVVEIFHLFGFRKIRPEDGKLAFSRRRPDTAGAIALPTAPTKLRSI